MSDDFIPTVTMSLRTNEPLTARFWCSHKCRITGWLSVRNLSTMDQLRVHFNQGGDDITFDPIKPLHTKQYQVNEGQQVWFSTTVTNQPFRIENAPYKPTNDEYFEDEAAVEQTEMIGNVPFAGGPVVVNAAAAFQKGYATQAQITTDPAVAGSQGTVEISRDGAVTYGPAIPVTEYATDPLRCVLNIGKVFTHLRITPNAGTLHYVVGR